MPEEVKLIDIDRLDRNNDKLRDELGIQVDPLPQPTSAYLGKVLQYVGSGGGSYQPGKFYECTFRNNDYHWQIVETESKPIRYSQYSYIPTAEQANVGQIIQYTGATNNSYKNGYFYKCTGHLNGSGTVTVIDDVIQYDSFTWEPIDVQNIPIWRGTRAQHDAAETAGTLPNNSLIGITDESPSGGSGGSGGSSNSGGGSSQVDTMPTPDASIAGKIVQYIGNTTDDYVNGYFYKCKTKDNVMFYWEGIFVQPETITEFNGYSFANLAYDQIANMIELADDGDIDLDDYWAVGDERTVSVAAIAANANGAFTTAMDAQDVTMVLMHNGYDGQTGMHYVVGQKDCLNQKARMNATDTNNGSWHGSLMNADLNSLFFPALASDFKSLCKAFNVRTAATYNGTTLESVEGTKVALFAEKEVLGSNSYSNTTEFNALTQIDYYKTSANRIKNVNDTASAWWLRSPCSSIAARFCNVSSNGYADRNNASNAYGVAPFCCI